MDQHSTDHGDRADIHLPDPSVWPLLVGVTALLLGFALVYWTRDRTSDFAGPLLGAAVLGVLIAAFGWAYEDGRMRTKAERAMPAAAAEEEARFTQVITFALAGGRYEFARSDGILHALDAADSGLRHLPGFQDLRIIAAPAAAGPSQVLVETTWSGRDGLATYEETRTTLLDTVAAHPDEVLPGSVQVFDMEVVRDTKNVSFRFGLGAAAAILGSVIVGGFMIGAGLTLFQEEGTATAVTPPANGAAPSNQLKVVATDNKFDKTTIEAPPNTDIKISWTNNGKVKHNLHFYDKQGGKTLADGAGSDSVFFDGGQSETLSFKTPGPGQYYFQCDLHPTEMKGTFVVKEGAPAGGEQASGGGAAAPAGSLTVIGTDNKFDKTTIDAAAGQPLTVVFKNSGKVKHNLHFYDRQGGKTLAPGAGSDTNFPDGGTSETLKFTSPGPGTYYYQCDLHPTEMKGTLNVK